MKFKVLLVYPNLQLVNLIPNSLAILSACLKKEGFDVKLFDTTFYRIKEKSDDEIRAEWGHYRPSDNAKLYKTTNVFDDFVKTVEEYKPNLIGFTSVDATHQLALDLLNKIDTSNINIVFGGIYSTFNYNELIFNPKINYVCRGEGEQFIVKLCKSLSQSGIPDIEFHNHSLADINTLPYEDFSIFEPDRFLRPMQGKMKKMLPLMIDRGCPYNCTFCVEHSLKKQLGYTYRIKNIDTLGDYMSYMKYTYNPEYIYFNSETFFARPMEHIEKFASLYKEKMDLPFCCMTRFETINPATVKILKHMGCDRISLGLEHGNQNFRKSVLNKRFTNYDVYKAMQLLNHNRINTTLFNIVGFPDETRELAQDTIKFNKFIKQIFNKIDITSSISVFQPYSGTPLRKYSINKGYISADATCSSLIGESVMDLPHFNTSEINDIVVNFTKLIN